MNLFEHAAERILAKIFELSKKVYYKKVYATFRNKYEVSPSFRFNGDGISFDGEGKITCGDNSYIGEFSTLQAAEGYSIQIGSNCAISHNVRVYTKTYEADQDFDSERSRRQVKFGNVEIGNGVWIGVNVLINPGIYVGDNAVIGANSVVINDVPAGAIFWGVPARWIRNKKTTG